MTLKFAFFANAYAGKFKIHCSAWKVSVKEV